MRPHPTVYSLNTAVWLRELGVTLDDVPQSELETIARTNHTSLAFVIRYALNHFIAEHKDKQLRLDMPS